ncbi:hypothetical protein ACFQZ4_00165 [Catellatospora coxensis]
MNPISVWPRPQHQLTSRKATVALVAFSADPLTPDAPLDARRFGMPAHPSVQGLDVRSHAREDDPDWFDSWHTGALAAIAARDLPDPAALRAARHCHMAQLEVDDPADLGHLQVAWAVAGWFVSQGSLAVLDAHAHRWHPAAAVAALAPDRPFALAAEAESSSRPARDPAWPCTPEAWPSSPART